MFPLFQSTSLRVTVLFFHGRCDIRLDESRRSNRNAGRLFRRGPSEKGQIRRVVQAFTWASQGPASVTKSKVDSKGGSGCYHDEFLKLANMRTGSGHSENVMAKTVVTVRSIEAFLLVTRNPPKRLQALNFAY